MNRRYQEYQKKKISVFHRVRDSIMKITIEEKKTEKKQILGYPVKRVSLFVQHTSVSRVMGIYSSLHQWVRFYL